MPFEGGRRRYMKEKKLIGENLKEFFHENFGSVRTVELNGQVWFVGSDIAERLEYSNKSRDIQRHCKNPIKYEVYQNGTSHNKARRSQEMLLINERDVVRLITKSKMTKAQEFEHWIFDEVIPSVMNYGGYVNDGKKSEFGSQIDFIQNHFTSFSPEIQKAMVVDLMKQQETHKEELDKANRTIDILINEYTTFDDFNRVANACMKAISREAGEEISVMWGIYYKFVYDKEGFNVKTRYKNEVERIQNERIASGKNPYSESTIKNKVTMLKTIKPSEYNKCLKILEAMAVKYGVDIEEIVKLNFNK